VRISHGKHGEVIRSFASVPRTRGNIFENYATIVYLHRKIGEASVAIQFGKRPFTRRIFRGTVHAPYAKVPDKRKTSKYA
jgi:hypothetical protein